MALKLTQHISAIFFLSLLLSSASQADVKVQIKNESTSTVDYLIDNFKYDDFNRKWTVLPANTTATGTIAFTTKFGHLELRIKEHGGDRLIYSYTPTGTNPEVIILIENTEVPDQLKVSKQKPTLEPKL